MYEETPNVEVVPTPGLGCHDRDTEYLGMQNVFELGYGKEGPYLKPRVRSVEGSGPFKPGTSFMSDEALDEVYQVWCEDRQAGIEHMSTMLYADAVWWGGKISENSCPSLAAMNSNYMGTGKPIPSDIVDEWCALVTDWLRCEMACEEDPEWAFVESYANGEFTIDWRCVTNAMSGIDPAGLNLTDVGTLVMGTVGAHVPHLLARVEGDMTWGDGMKGYATSRVGRCPEDSKLLGPESHSASFTVWLDVDRAKVTPSNEHMVTARWAASLAEGDNVVVIHPGGRSGPHVITYRRKMLEMLLPTPFHSGRFMFFFEEYKNNASGARSLTVTQKGRVTCPRAQMIDPVTISLSPLAVDLLREICRWIRYCSTSHSAEQRASSTFRGRTWKKGICSRIPFCSPWSVLHDVMIAEGGFPAYLLQVYADLVASVTPSAGEMAYFMKLCTSNHVMSRPGCYVPSTDSIIASDLYHRFTSNTVVITPIKARLYSDALAVNSRFFATTTPILIEWPTCRRI
jgi:hypothetical protein